jgi:hypothetical protein
MSAYGYLAGHGCRLGGDQEGDIALGDYVKGFSG